MGRSEGRSREVRGRRKGRSRIGRRELKSGEVGVGGRERAEKYGEGGSREVRGKRKWMSMEEGVRE